MCNSAYRAVGGTGGAKKVKIGAETDVESAAAAAVANQRVHGFGNRIVNHRQLLLFPSDRYLV
jgi:hypothetical protein